MNTYNLRETGSKIEELLHKIDVLSKDDIGLDQVNNTSDNDKPVSTLQRQALNEVLKAAKTYTDNEIAEFDFIKIVSVLPSEGLPNRIYLVPKTEVNENNLFDEYLWVNNAWEWIATKSVDVDLTDVYSIKETDELLDDKVDKEEGKGLSTNDYTDKEKEKLEVLINYDDTELRLRDERLKYYGDPNIVPTDESIFNFWKDDTDISKGAYIQLKEKSVSGEIVIPYKCTIDGIEYIVTGIGVNSPGFMDASNITKVIMPNTIVILGTSCFDGCTSMTNIKMSENVTKIEWRAFYNCIYLESINIPNSVTIVEQEAFGMCPRLTITCAEGSSVDTYAKEHGIPVVYTSEVTKEFVLSNGGKPNVITEVADTLILEDNQDAQLGEITSLVLSMPENIEPTYHSLFNFKSGETPTSLNYTDTPIIWRGDDCDEDGDFVPEPNTIYEVSVKNLGTNGIVANVFNGVGEKKWDEIVGDTRLEIQSDEDLETLRDFKSGIMVVTVNKDNWEDFISSAEDNNGDFGMYMSSATMGGKTENYKNILVYSGKHYYYESNQPVVDAETGEIIPQYPTQRYVQYFIDDNIIYKRVIELAENSDAFGSYVSFEKIEGVTKEYVDDMVGDIETALDNIIVIQNELIGGDNK